jgi:hypothetical protein
LFWPYQAKTASFIASPLVAGIAARYRLGGSCERPASTELPSWRRPGQAASALFGPGRETVAPGSTVLGVSPSTIDRLRDDGEIEAINVRGTVKVLVPSHPAQQLRVHVRR